MPKPSASVLGWTPTGRYLLINGWFGLRIEQLMEHESGRTTWRRVTRPDELARAMAAITTKAVLHDSLCASHRGHACNCPSAAFSKDQP
jgi:hypothetical protein